jgi:hypothetical protein
VDSKAPGFSLPNAAGQLMTLIQGRHLVLPGCLMQPLNARQSFIDSRYLMSPVCIMRNPDAAAPVRHGRFRLSPARARNSAPGGLID